MTPHTFLFDMDGTLLDSSAAVIDAVAAGLERAYAHHGLAIAPADRSLIARCMGLPTDAYFRAAFAPDSVPPEVREEFALSYGRFTADAEEEAVAAGATRLYNAVPDALDALQARGHRLLLFSNAGARYFRAIIAGHGLDRWFDRALCVEEARRDGLAEDKDGMVRELAADPATTVVVGDRVHDIDAGRRAGARTVGCRYGFGDAEEFRDATWTVDSPAEWPDLPL